MDSYFHLHICEDGPSQQSFGAVSPAATQLLTHQQVLSKPLLAVQHTAKLFKFSSCR